MIYLVFTKFSFKVHEHNFECKIQVQFFLLDACRSNFFKSLARKKIDIYYFYLLWGAKEFFYTPKEFLYPYYYYIMFFLVFLLFLAPFVVRNSKIS